MLTHSTCVCVWDRTTVLFTVLTFPERPEVSDPSRGFDWLHADTQTRAPGSFNGIVTWTV